MAVITDHLVHLFVPQPRRNSHEWELTAYNGLISRMYHDGSTRCRLRQSVTAERFDIFLRKFQTIHSMSAFFGENIYGSAKLSVPTFLVESAATRANDYEAS
jgi:hypothetical protein